MSEEVQKPMVEISGYERSTPAGGKVFAGRIPDDRGGGVSFVFTSPDGAVTYLALSDAAFDAVNLLHEDLNRPLVQTYKVLIQAMGDGKFPEDTKAEWTLIKPDEIPPPEPATP